MSHPRRAILVNIAFALSLGLGAAQAAPAAPAAPNASQLNAFFRAVQLDDVKTVQAMLGSKVNANQLNPLGAEPGLVQAVREDAMRVFHAFLAHPGTDLEAKASNGNTALMMAAYKRNRTAVEALLARGAKVDQPGWTALHYAAASGDDAIARLLLARGAKVDAVSPLKSGAYTPMMVAAREGHDGTALLLITHGADRSRTNSEGLTAVQIAERAGKPRVAKSIERGPR
ncbi:ankyrin repeat domain-containing protein [Massilia niabensis]|uniref:Ankyrin repeat domain-containing protein n=1 Tax=Massilia niabensis TaxID=544910 RepID=A0ABW0LAI5_9BURK